MDRPGGGRYSRPGTFGYPGTLMVHAVEEDLEMIGSGRNGNVYRGPGGEAIKVLRLDRFESLAEAVRAAAEEETRARLVEELRPEAPRFRGRTERGGMPCLRYELIEGPAVGRIFDTRPFEGLRVARDMGALHARICRTAVDPGALPRFSEAYGWRIRDSEWASEGLKRALFSFIDEEGGTSLCHGDFHPENVLASPAGLRVIDWEGAYRGQPMADAARTVYLLERGRAPSRDDARMGAAELAFRALASRAYRRAFFEKAGGFDPRRWRRWGLVIAVCRVVEGIRGEIPWIQERIAAAERDLLARGAL